MTTTVAIAPVRKRRTFGKIHRLGSSAQVCTRNEGMMSHSHSDALVFFGATGDLAHEKIFPSLQAMLKRRHLDVPARQARRAKAR
jgi:hypothetical protein